MKPFRDIMKERSWWVASTSRDIAATHLLLDGGKLCVPELENGQFLNVYFACLLSGQRLSVVELRSTIFPFFVDVDARVKDTTIGIDAFHMVFRCIYNAAASFWVVKEDALTLIVAKADFKKEDSGLIKRGFHLHFPTVYVNAPIALAFREELVKELDQCCAGLCSESWAEVIDSAVYKSSGLRLLYSCKGKDSRPYSPAFLYKNNDEVIEIPAALSAIERRGYVHQCSIRLLCEAELTRCKAGLDNLADHPLVHKAVGSVVGTSLPLTAFEEFLPMVQAALPGVYASQKFVGIFKTEHAVYLRSSSRFCQNVMREHRTSTVYFSITRRGLTQRCYCRKDDHGCDVFQSELYSLPEAVVEAFLGCSPDSECCTRALPSKKKASALNDLLSKSRFTHVRKRHKCK
jgi:Herpesviridae UL52/UL70 DNA primase